MNLLWKEGNFQPGTVAAAPVHRYMLVVLFSSTYSLGYVFSMFMLRSIIA